MCGIHIIIDKYNRLNEISIEHMLAATHHRGPDARQWKVIRSARQTIWMASNRLKISDLRDVANQPMCSEDNRHILVFNGAIYNHNHVRKQELPETNFKTTSDTETLLHLLIKKHTAAPALLNGMFTLGFYDQHTERFLLARDRWGMKPLYWFENSAFVIVSSEIKGILASGLVAKEPNLTQIPHYLLFNFARRPDTFYQNIFELEPGSICSFLPGQSLQEVMRLTIPDRQVNRFSETAGFALQRNIISSDKLITELDNALQQTARYWQADVPAGLLLSGGVDSTLLLACAHQAGIQSLPVFTIAYSVADKAYATQDHLYARRAAHQYKADLHEVPVDSNLLEQFPEWITTLDQPVADGAAWLTFLLAQEARKHVRVLISGAGADELFAGYNRHWAYYQYLKLYPFIRHYLPLSARKLPDFFAQSHYGRLWQKALQQLHPLPAQTFIRFTAGTTAFSGIDKIDWESGFIKDLKTRPTDFVENYLAAALRFEQTHYLIGDVLSITDRMTMQHGIEARLPYLDDTLVAVAQSVLATTLLRCGRKWLLKRILSQRQGKAYTSRHKEGFGMPFGHWLRTTSVAKHITAPVKNRNSLAYSIIDYSFANNLLQSHQLGKASYPAELWSLALLTAWLEKEF